jgi:Zn-dependent peptidase ImmA (M78 family)
MAETIGSATTVGRERAAALLALRREKPPIDIASIIESFGIHVVERTLPEGTRGTIGDIAGQRAIILNRTWSFSSEGERRWVLAEELGHILLEHRLVESTAPGQPRVGLLEWQRGRYEREAKAFAAELLMPLVEVRRRWILEGELPAAPAYHGDGLGRIIRKLARDFNVTMTAIRIRLQELRLLSQPESIVGGRRGRKSGGARR